MKILKQITIVLTILHGSIILGMQQPPAQIAALVQEHQWWLAEQLKQLSYPELTNDSINTLVHYFTSKTNRFYWELDDAHKLITNTLFTEEMSIAMSKIINAAIKVHNQMPQKRSSSDKNDLVSNIIGEIVSTHGGTLYEGAADQFPDADFS